MTMMIPDDRWPFLESGLETTVELLGELMNLKPNEEVEMMEATAKKLTEAIYAVYEYNYGELKLSTRKRRRDDHQIMVRIAEDENELSMLLFFQKNCLQFVLSLMDRVDVACTSEMRERLSLPRERAKLHYRFFASKTDPILGPLSTEICPICLEEFGVEGLQHVARAEGCSHKYHRYCILPWLQSRGTCPVCRRNSSTIAECLCYY